MVGVRSGRAGANDLGEDTTPAAAAGMAAAAAALQQSTAAAAAACMWMCGGGRCGPGYSFAILERGRGRRRSTRSRACRFAHQAAPYHFE